MFVPWTTDERRNQWNPLSELSLASLQICDLDDDQASIGRPSELNPFPRCSSWLLLWAFVGGQRQATETQGGSRGTDGHSACVCDAQQSPINATGVCQKGFVQVPNIVCSRTGTRSFLKDSAGGQGQSSGQEMPSKVHRRESESYRLWKGCGASFCFDLAMLHSQKTKLKTSTRVAL